MNVMIYDNDANSIEDFFTNIKSVKDNINVVKVTNQDQFLKNYKNDVYDIVFIDINDQEGRDLKNEVIRINPSQKTVTINNSFSCSDSLGCDHCKENTHNYRIFKPYNPIDIVKSFNDDIKCEYNYCDNSLLSKLHILSKSYLDIKFDDVMFRFIIALGRNDDILSHTSAVDLIHILNMNNIHYEVFDTYIQIFEKKPVISDMMLKLKEFLETQDFHIDLQKHNDGTPFMYSKEIIDNETIKRISEICESYNYTIHVSSNHLIYIDL